MNCKYEVYHRKKLHYCNISIPKIRCYTSKKQYNKQNYYKTTVILAFILQICKYIETATTPLGVSSNYKRLFGRARQKACGHGGPQAIRSSSMTNGRGFKVAKGVWCLLDQIYFLEKN